MSKETWCPYCKANHAVPPHGGNPTDCPLWCDWCLCACADYQTKKLGKLQELLRVAKEDES